MVSLTVAPVAGEKNGSGRDGGWRFRDGTTILKRGWSAGTVSIFRYGPGANGNTSNCASRRCGFLVVLVIGRRVSGSDPVMREYCVVKAQHNSRGRLLLAACFESNDIWKANGLVPRFHGNRRKLEGG